MLKIVMLVLQMAVLPVLMLVNMTTQSFSSGLGMAVSLQADGRGLPPGELLVREFHQDLPGVL